MKPTSLILCAACVLAMPATLPAQAGESLSSMRTTIGPRVEPGIVWSRTQSFKQGKSGITCYNIVGRPYTWTGSGRCPIS